MKSSVLCGTLLLAHSLTASPILNDPFGLASPALVITFDEVVLLATTPITTQYSALGVTFSGVFYDTQAIAFGSVVSPVAENFDGSTTNNPFSLLFSTPQTAVAFAFVTNAGETTTFTALLGGSVVETFAAATNLTGNYWGFTTATAFDEIQISVDGAVNGAAGFDNIQLGSLASIPEPASLSLFAMGLIAFGFMGRRRSR